MADPTRKIYDIRLNISLDQTHKAMITQLSVEQRCSEAAIVRSLIFAAFETVFRSTPHCANANKCLCPQMHVPQPRQAETVDETIQRIALGRDPETPAA